MKAQINRSVVVLGTGRYLPKRLISQDVLSGMLSNYDEERSGDFGTWVDRVTHIHERRYVDTETAGDLGAMASKRAIEMAGIKPTDLDLILFASFTSASSVPGDHVLLAREIGADATPSFTMTAACAGSVIGMAMAYGLLSSGMMKRILVVGTETISPVLDYDDPLTTILFGDGAGAVVLGTVPDSEGGMLPPTLGHNFNYENITMPNINVPFLSTEREPRTADKPRAVEQAYLKMIAGPSVLRNAVNTMAGCVHRVLGYENGSDASFKDTAAGMRLVPHQANGRIVDGLAKKLGANPERVTKTLYKAGNISAASSLIALDYAMRDGNIRAVRDPETDRIVELEHVSDPIRKGELVVMPTIAAGYLYGAVAFVHPG